jgi:hypothetical protein
LVVVVVVLVVGPRQYKELVEILVNLLVSVQLEEAVAVVEKVAAV